MLKTFDIYEEGFVVMEGSAKAHYIGSANGEDFLDACKRFIEATGTGYINTRYAGINVVSRIYS